MSIGINTRAVKGSEPEAIKTIGIIGGGKVGLHILELFSDSNLAKILYVVDREKTAPAMQYATKNHISTFTDIDEALKTKETDFIFEVTGSNKVAEIIKSKLDGRNTELVTHEMAFILLQSVEQKNQSVKNEVIKEITGIHSEILTSLKSIKKLVNNIKDIAEEMVMLAINARIEAARAGEEGKGFSVVAQKMGQAVQMVQDTIPQIEVVSSDILSVSDKIDVSLNNLR